MEIEAMTKSESGDVGKPGALVLRVAETAVLLRMSTQAAYDAIAKHQIPHIRIGGMIKVPRVQLERLLSGPISRKACEGSTKKTRLNRVS
jgi:excisionase family DNA binding protein